MEDLLLLRPDVASTSGRGRESLTPFVPASGETFNESPGFYRLGAIFSGTSPTSIFFEGFQSFGHNVPGETWVDGPPAPTDGPPAASLPHSPMRFVGHGRPCARQGRR